MFQIKLITGGTGSFGNAVLKRFISSDIEEIRIFSRDEKKKRYDNPITTQKKIYLGDVKDPLHVDASKGVDFAFHAAAFSKFRRNFAMQAVKTNVIGTENILDSYKKCFSCSLPKY